MLNLKRHEEKNRRPYSLRHALCALPFGRGAAANENSRIGYLAIASHSAESARIEAFRKGLRELGYVEGKNIVIEWRFAEGKLDRLPALAAELVRLKVESSSRLVHADPCRQGSNFYDSHRHAQDNDPVGNGFVASLARPGGNITGLSNLAPELSGKRLELLKEIVPKLSRVAVIGTSTIRATRKC